MKKPINSAIQSLCHSQEWVYDKTSSGPTHPLPDSNKCLRIRNGPTANGNNIQLWGCTGAIAQKIVIK